MKFSKEGAYGLPQDGFDLIALKVIYTPVEIFIPQLIYFYLGGNISTTAEIFSPGWELNKIIMSYVGHRMYQ